jgi:hypothetical protein
VTQRRRTKGKKSDDNFDRVMSDLGVTGPINRERRRMAHDLDRESTQALQAACPSCGAGPGTGCVSIDGSPHASRLQP